MYICSTGFSRMLTPKLIILFRCFDGLDYLEDQRLMLSKHFAKQCLKFDKSRDMFPLNENYVENVRNSEKFRVNFAKKLLAFGVGTTKLKKAIVL